VTSWLGYVDFHPAFFILLSLYLLTRARTTLATAVGGLPLGIAVAMKPQAITMVAMLGAFVVVRSVQARRLDDAEVVRAGALMFGPVAVFAAYSAYFTAHGRGWLFLVRSYRDVTKALPALTAQMPNIWYPVADLYAKGGEPITSVVEPKAFHTLAAVLTAGVLVFVTARLARDSDRRSFPVTVLLLFTAGAAVLPMLMTRAHENHFFLAATFGVLLVARLADRPLTLLVNALLAVQALHLFGLYGLGENRVSTALGLEKWLDPDVEGIRYGVRAYALDQPHLQTLVACITTVLFVATAYRVVTILRTAMLARSVAADRLEGD
jgi:Gpi18-like mannosyltransferase